MSRRPGIVVSLHLEGRLAVLVASDELGAERQSRLEAAGARVELVPPDDYHADVCAGAFVVLASSGDETLNRRIGNDARAAGSLVYVHDRPALSDLSMSALVRRGPLVIAVSTEGTAPALAGRLRAELQRLVDDAGVDIDRLLALIADKRDQLSGRQRTDEMRRLAATVSIQGRIAIGDADPAK